MRHYDSTLWASLSREAGIKPRAATSRGARGLKCFS